MASIILTSQLGEPSSWQKISFHMLVELGFLRENSISAFLPWWFPWTMHVDSASSSLEKCEGLLCIGLVAWQVSFGTLFGLSSGIFFRYIVLLAFNSSDGGYPWPDSSTRWLDSYRATQGWSTKGAGNWSGSTRLRPVLLSTLRVSCMLPLLFYFLDKLFNQFLTMDWRVTSML